MLYVMFGIINGIMFGIKTVAEYAMTKRQQDLQKLVIVNQNYMMVRDGMGKKFTFNCAVNSEPEEMP